MGNLKLHMMTYTAEKAYKCDTCGNPVAHIVTLTSHVRTRMREKPYPCDICGKLYILSSHLKEHRMIHTC